MKGNEWYETASIESVTKRANYIYLQYWTHILDMKVLTDCGTTVTTTSRCGTLLNICGSDCKPTTCGTHYTPEPSSETSATQQPLLPLTHPRKLVLWRGTRNGHGYLLMRLKSCSSYRRGLLTTMTLFSGGQGGMHNSQIFLVSREIFFPSQVRISPLLFAELLTYLHT
jgi:hypothetical protein